METITSVSNPKIKNLAALQQKSSERRSRGLFVVEGLRELQHCTEAGYEVDSIFVCPEIAGNPSDAREPLPGLCLDASPERREPGTKIFGISRKVYEKVAYREGTEGVIAEVRCRQHRLEDLKLTSSPLICVLESVEKPGNLGAVLRSADAAGADAVIVCDPRTDLYNPNLIRASIGAAFTVPVAVCESADAIKWLKANNIRILTAQLQDSELYYDSDMTGGTAIVMGTEDRGLSPLWRLAADSHIRIPMLGRLDSLNVSVSAAILLFEALRQRKNG